MKRPHALLAVLIFTASMVANVSALPEEGQGRRLVLVAGNGSAIDSLSPAEVRKLYLGVAVVKGGQPVLPLRNQTDPLLQEVFLQKVIFMSAPQYERALATRLIRAESSVRPPVYDSPETLHAKLQTAATAVTYMWADAAKAAGVKVVAELWQEKKE